eukprot:TRINITY_DN65850_c0_g1_i1.p1 TRINITY_DN65850_c0_g1~~TRINITY_DN65850_c0_g1_i1.p1  ORF type:complete len:614 (-),score=99.22 TRINITY_DN65850_c0_g1_i1:324-2105(-)
MGGDDALYHNALLSLMGMEGIPVLMYGSEQSVQGHHAPLWETGYSSKDMTFSIIQRTLWLRRRFDGFHSFALRILFSDNDFLIFSRGPLVFAVSNLGTSVKRSSNVIIPGTGDSIEDLIGVRVCDILSAQSEGSISDCFTMDAGEEMHFASGTPRLYAPEPVVQELLREEATQVEEDEDATELGWRQQLPESFGVRLLQAHEWDKIWPSPPSVGDVEVAIRTPRAILPSGVKVNDPLAWGPAWAPPLHAWNPPLGEATKIARRATFHNACLYMEREIHVIYMPRPDQAFALCRNDGECGYMTPRLNASEKFKTTVATMRSKGSIDGPEIFHLTYAMLYAGVYHVVAEALPSIVAHLPSLRRGELQLLIHANKEVLTPMLVQMGALKSAIFVPEPVPVGQNFHICTPELHVDMRKEGFFSATRLHGLRREMQLPELSKHIVSQRRSILVLSRGNSTRSLSNEADLIKGLAALDRLVEVLTPEPDNFVEVLAAMSRADVIVGAHGANMANIMFAAQGTKVVEIVPQVPFHLVNNHYRHVAGALGFKYVAFGQEVTNYDQELASDPISQSRAITHYAVDVERFKAAVAELLDEKTS